MISGFGLPRRGAAKAMRKLGPAAWTRALAGVFAATLAAGPSVGQVLSVGSDGAVSVYDGPAVFTDGKVSPIVPAPVRTAAPGDRSVDLTRAADAAHLSPALLAAVAWRESGFRSDRTSRAGAIGEMQLMPDTARQLGVDPTRADQNLRGGAIYLRNMLIRYHGDLPTALAAYNAGPGAVDRYRGAPPYKETQAYVGSILDRLSDVALRGAPKGSGSVGKGGE